MDPAQLIREARRRAGLTLRQLAVRAHTSHSALAAYEGGSKTPTTATLLRVLDAAGFELVASLVATGPFEDRGRRGEELVEVLDLADRFPSEHSPTIDYPVFARP